MLKPLSRRNLIKKLRDCGFEGPYSGGKHEYMIGKNGFKLMIPNPHGADIGVVLLKRMLKEAGLKDADFW